MLAIAGMLAAAPLLALEITKDDRPTLDEMRKVLLSGSLRGREEAARRLLKDGSAEAMKALFDGMADKFAAYIVTDVLLEKVEKETEGMAERLLSGMEHEHWRTRMLTAYLLGRCWDKGASKALARALEDENYNVRLYAAEALRYAGDKDAVDALVKALRNFCCLIRLEAAAALGEIGDRKAVPALIVALDDPDAAINAAKALGKMGGEEAEKALVSKVGSRSVQVDERRMAWEMLAISKDADMKVVWAAIEALGKFSKNREIAGLFRGTTRSGPDWSPDERTRKALREAAEAIEGRAAK